MAFADKNLRAYTGYRPYVFMSYCHKDNEKVEPILRALQGKYNVWYDEGIIPASEWEKVIAERVEQCGFFLALISKSYLESEPCMDELAYAKRHKLPRLLILIEDITLPNEIELNHGRRQYLRKQDISTTEKLLVNIGKTTGIEVCSCYSATSDTLISRVWRIFESWGHSVGDKIVRFIIRAAFIATIVFGLFVFSIRVLIPELTKPDPTPLIIPVEDYLIKEEIDGITITGYTGNESNIVIPSEIDNSPVVRIGTNAFYNYDFIASVSLPDSITEICDAAFFNCSCLNSITLSNNLRSIGKHAFWGCTSLRHIKLPSSVLTIGDMAFCHCESLDYIVIPDSVKIIGNLTFAYCTSLYAVEFSNSMYGIGIWAFYGCTKLSDVQLMQNVKYIMGGAFSGCNSLSNVYFTGTDTQWRSLEISERNDPFEAATIYIKSQKKTLERKSYG